MAEKIILFGGTFDPVHTGHIEVAQAAAEKIGAKKVILIPARRSPHKNQKPLAEDIDRVSMLKLAIAGKNIFQISPIELNRAEPSYTIDTIHQVQQSFGSNYELYWLIGADMLSSLSKWYKIDELLNECNICVMNRGGFDKPDFDSLADKFSKDNIEKLRENSIETPAIEISSTEIRQKLFNDEDVSQYLHPKVLNYIRSRRLYTLTD
ncbi:MAG: nicotinate (nicotinamide) nucleotide adenylyltransferase [Phycisphaerae bacterium]|jgi:nicotinate-nucleotide adenylyltransferase